MLFLEPVISNLVSYELILLCLGPPPSHEPCGRLRFRLLYHNSKLFFNLFQFLTNLSDVVILRFKLILLRYESGNHFFMNLNLVRF